MVNNRRGSLVENCTKLTLDYIYLVWLILRLYSIKHKIEMRISLIWIFDMKASRRKYISQCIFYFHWIFDCLCMYECFGNGRLYMCYLGIIFVYFSLYNITMAYEPHISPPGYIHTHPPYTEYNCIGIRWKILSSKWNHQENRFFAHSVCTTTHHVVPYRAYRLVFYCAVLQSWYFTQKAQTYL